MTQPTETVYIDTDSEWYPVYCFDLDEWGTAVTVPTEVAARWREVFAQFAQVQEEMREAFKREHGSENIDTTGM